MSFKYVCMYVQINYIIFVRQLKYCFVCTCSFLGEMYDKKSGSIGEWKIDRRQYLNGIRKNGKWFIERRRADEWLKSEKCVG